MQQASKVSPMLNITCSATGHTYTGLSQIARVYCMCTEPCTCSTSSSPSILVSDRLISMWKSERKEAQYLTRHLVLYNVHGVLCVPEWACPHQRLCLWSQQTYIHAPKERTAVPGSIFTYEMYTLILQLCWLVLYLKTVLMSTMRTQSSIISQTLNCSELSLLQYENLYQSMITNFTPTPLPYHIWFHLALASPPEV